MKFFHGSIRHFFFQRNVQRQIVRATKCRLPEYFISMYLQLKEMKSKLDDSEAEMSRKYKAKVSSLDARVIALEEQLEAAVR